MQNTVHIYGLIDPRTQELRYIGKTNKKPEKRLKEHLECRGQGHKINWIKDILASGSTPEIFVIEDVPEHEWQDSERFWISYFRYIGSNLTNVGNGGYGGTTTPETRAKIGAAQRGMKRSEVAKIHYRQSTSFHRPEIQMLGRMAQSGKPMSDEQKEKIRQIATGRKFSEETKKKLSKMRIGRKHKQESIEKMRNFSDKRMRDPITGRYIRRNNNND